MTPALKRPYHWPLAVTDAGRGKSFRGSEQNCSLAAKHKHGQENEGIRDGNVSFGSGDLNRDSRANDHGHQDQNHQPEVELLYG